MGFLARGRHRAVTLIGLGCAALLVAAAPATAASKGHKSHGPQAVFTQTNNPNANSVLVFKRNSNGTLAEPPTSVSTGGKGLSPQPPFGFPIVDSQGSVKLTPDGRLLFVVNSGDNSVTSFRVSESGSLKLADRASSGGGLPISLTTHGNLLYVLNEGTKNQGAGISGLRFSSNGKMTALSNSTRSLSVPSPSSLAAQIGFTPNGRVLVVTERCYAFLGGCPGYPRGIIDTFKMHSNGRPGAARLHGARAYGPFGFDFSGSHMVLSFTGFVGTPPNPGDFTQLNGRASSDRVSNSGALAQGPIVSTNGRGACWTVTTKDGRYAFITNSLSDAVAPPNGGPGSGKGAVARFSVAKTGSLDLLGTSDVSPDLSSAQPGPHPAFATDLTLSSDSKYLYVLVPTLNQGPPNDNTSHIDVYRRSGGNLTHLQTTSFTLPGGVSGLAAG